MRGNYLSSDCKVERAFYAWYGSVFSAALIQVEHGCCFCPGHCFEVVASLKWIYTLVLVSMTSTVSDTVTSFVRTNPSVILTWLILPLFCHLDLWVWVVGEYSYITTLHFFRRSILNFLSSFVSSGPWLWNGTRNSHVYWAFWYVNVSTYIGVCR